MTPPADILFLYTVYAHPSDYPNDYVVRRLSIPRDKSTLILQDKTLVAKSPDLDSIRSQLADLGLTSIGRDTNDDPAILEVWI